MELINEFRVGVPVPDAWKVLTDVERIAPLMPGAQLQEVEGDEYRGVVKVKVGPITAQYKGTATFIEQDEAAGRVVIKATGRDTRGQGNASATISATMQPDGDGTKVSVVTDLTVTGKVAQFGRGVLADVSAKLLGQFVDSLEADLSSSGNPSPGSAEATEPAATTAAAPAGTAPPATGATPSEPAPAGATPSGESSAASAGPRRIEGPEAQPVDLLAVAGGVAREHKLLRLVPLAAIAVVVLLVLAAGRARRRARATS
jgi:carbon monoxide dehydrogenase subunit G